MRPAPTFLLALTLVACPKTPDKPEETAETQPPDTQETAAPQADPCAEQGLERRAFQVVEESTAMYATAADFTVTTRSGDWSLQESWTGCDVILLVQDGPSQASGWPTDLWERDVDELFERLPRNVQLLFMSTATSTDAIEASLDLLQGQVDSELAAMSEEDRAWWGGRVHYVTQRAQTISGWVDDLMWSPGWGVGIDRLQRIRYIGSYADPTRYHSSYGWFEPNLSMVANEATYYNYEAEREAELEADDALVVTIFDDGYVSGSDYAEVELPDASTLSGYDTLKIDAFMGCGGVGEYGYCPAWDYMAYLYVCDMPAEDNPYADTACQPAVEAVMGECHADGEAQGSECSSAESCEDKSGAVWTCEGYEESIAADTLAGSCDTPLGEATEASYSCNTDGSGYDDLSCACDTELGRWITTYHREGRWVHDVSPLLPLLKDGGAHKFRFNTTGPYTLDVDLRFSDAGEDTRAEEISHLFSGCDLTGTCNDSYTEPATVEIPADATKVGLATVITGHGMSDPGNCAEFCDMDHIFTVNEASDEEVVVDFPDAGSTWGCLEQVAEGTVPNQYGTWWYGRGGWCPGKHVPVELHDITALVTPGEDASITYRVERDGSDYQATSSWAHTDVAAWLVVER